MIVSLRRRVFWSILISAAGVLLAILAAINVLGLVQTASKRDTILDSALMMLMPEHDPERERGAPPGGRDNFELMRSVSEDELGVIMINANSAVVLKAGCADQMEEETLSAITEAALADPKGRGRAQGWEYKAIPNPEGMGVSFLDAASLRRENAQTALLSLAAFAVACGLFALLARLLSRIIVKPVEDNMQAQKRFVADASHELKTPLTVIDANASVLEQSIGQNKWLDYIKEQTERMSGLVNGLLQLSRLEESAAADSPRRKEAFDAAEAVMTAALPFESLAFEKGLNLDVDTPDTLEARGSRQDLEQLAAILTDNAVKHSPAGGTVRISLKKSALKRGLREEPALKLQVSNSGDDIPPEALPHIFDRFYRADESRAYKGNSYGLGLAIAKSLVEKNNGSIAAESRKGVTEFTLVLPI